MMRGMLSAEASCTTLHGMDQKFVDKLINRLPRLLAMSSDDVVDIRPSLECKSFIDDEGKYGSESLK
jgi:hypothetical protein